LYRAEERKWNRQIREEKVGIIRIAILAAVLILLVMILDSIAYNAKFSLLMFSLVYISLFGIIAGFAFAVCSIIRSYRSMPFLRTAVAAILCMAFPIILFTFGIICFILGIGSIPN